MGHCAITAGSTDCKLPGMLAAVRGSAHEAPSIGWGIVSRRRPGHDNNIRQKKRGRERDRDQHCLSNQSTRVTDELPDPRMSAAPPTFSSASACAQAAYATRLLRTLASRSTRESCRTHVGRGSSETTPVQVRCRDQRARHASFEVPPEDPTGCAGATRGF